MTRVERELPTDEAHDLLELVRQISVDLLAPRVGDAEEKGQFPRDVFQHVGPLRAAVPALPRASWAAAASRTSSTCRRSRSWRPPGAPSALGVSVHTLACYPLAEFGTPEQQERWLPDMLGGEQLGAYCLSETDIRLGRGGAAHPCGARRRRLHGDRRRRPGSPTAASPTSTASWRAPARTARAASPACWSTPARPGSAARRPSTRWASAPRRRPRSSSTAPASTADRLIGEEGQGFRIALSALDSGRLGIAACAVGIAQAALECATAYAKEREQFGRRDHRLPGAVVPAGRHGHRRSPPPVSSTWPRPGAATPAGRSARRRPWPSCSPPTCA